MCEFLDTPFRTLLISPFNQAGIDDAFREVWTASGSIHKRGERLGKTSDNAALVSVRVVHTGRLPTGCPGQRFPVPQLHVFLFR